MEYAIVKFVCPFAVGLCLTLGCAARETVEQPELLRLEQVPNNVMQAAREKLPDVRFDSAWKAREHGQEVYEVRGKTPDGKVYEVEVGLDGKVVGVE